MLRTKTLNSAVESALSHNSLIRNILELVTSAALRLGFRRTADYGLIWHTPCDRHTHAWVGKSANGVPTQSRNQMRFVRIVRQHGRPQRAYTLVEVLFAVAAMGFISVSLFAGLGSGFALVEVTRENLRATQILLERMETIRLYRWDQITDDKCIPRTFTSYFYPDALATGGGGIMYTGTIAVTSVSGDLPAAYRDEMRQVRVRIGWMSSKVPREREMVTYTARHGLQNYVYSPASNP